MSKRLRVLVADFLAEDRVERPILEDIADLILAKASHESELIPLLPEADAVIVFHDIKLLSEATWSRADRCKLVVRAGVGFDNIDLQATGKRGIAACNVPDYGTEEVADHAIMLLLAVTRKLMDAHESMRKGEWDCGIIAGTPRLRGRTFGIVGCGRIGTATALRAKAFGLDVVFYDPLVPRGVEKALGIRRANTLQELMSQSHFVSLHCYLNEGTRKLINAESLSWMRPGAVLINTARGPVVDQQALVAALESGHLSAAGIDVFEQEPMTDERLRVMKNVVLTPHAAFYSVEAYDEMRRKTAEEIRRGLTNQPLWNVVNRQWLQLPRTAV